MSKLINKELKPSEKPVKPKKPLPIKEAPVKIPAPCCLTEEQVREIARDEIDKYMQTLPKFPAYRGT